MTFEAPHAPPGQTRKPPADPHAVADGQATPRRTGAFAIVMTVLAAAIAVLVVWSPVESPLHPAWEQAHGIVLVLLASLYAWWMWAQPATRPLRVAAAGGVAAGMALILTNIAAFHADLATRESLETVAVGVTDSLFLTSIAMAWCDVPRRLLWLAAAVGLLALTPT